MIVLCKSISGNDIPDEQRFPGESSNAEYSPLIVGDKYFVFAMIFYKNRIDYLICPCDSAPMWAPSCLFSIENSQLNAKFHTVAIEKNCEFGWLHETYGAQFIIGYKEITESFDHYAGIIERDEEDLKIFLAKNQSFLNTSLYFEFGNLGSI